MAKEIKMNAETGKIGTTKKSFTFTVLSNGNEINFQQGGTGFNPFEIMGFLEVMKANIAKGIK